MHKGQGTVPDGGKGWHRASPTGRGKTEKRKIVEGERHTERRGERESRREGGREGGDLLNSGSLVPSEEGPGSWQE